MQEKYYHISGKKDGIRLESRVLEERIQEAVAGGLRNLEIDAFGQHGIGGRLWKNGPEPVCVRVKGQSGQRLGAMGFPGTRIEAMGPASDDVGWLNAGAQIIVHGNAGNGVGNAMAQGAIYVGGNIGARGMTMTKHNPRFDPPQLWVLGSAGDYFGEFMAGGIAVVCGHESQHSGIVLGYRPLVGGEFMAGGIAAVVCGHEYQHSGNVLGYRPLVGMVGGKVFFRGPCSEFSRTDAKEVAIGREDWNWLCENLKKFLHALGRSELFAQMAEISQWRLLAARTPQEKANSALRSMSSFRREVWDKELGSGGLIGDLTLLERDPVPLIPAGDLRRWVPVWENRKYLAPCEGTCPTGIPVQQRWQLIREGRVDEAVDLALAYTPFPATVCGYLCPRLCMEACTRHEQLMPAVDISQLGRASIQAGLPEMPEISGKRIAVIGGGPAGISVAWQLRRRGHDAVVFDRSETLGGKISSVIPESRIPREVVDAELERVRQVIPHVRPDHDLNREDVIRLQSEYDYLVIATGAQKPRLIPVPGKERLIPANTFLAQARSGAIDPGKSVVVIGAGNVGCDAAVEAHRLGAQNITLIDVQKPLSFGKEREAAEKIGAKFRWPCFTRQITDQGVELSDGEVIEADTVIISIGDVPDLDFLPENVNTERGFIAVDENFRTSDPAVFAIGDAVKPGLITDAIGAGRRVAAAIADLAQGKTPAFESRPIIDRSRVSLEYFDPRITGFESIDQCGAQCASCGTCRDCGICVAICPQTAVSRQELADGAYQYAVDESRCIGCGFCADACPCGVWNMIENFPLE